jgi:hypothetical protein
MHYTNWSEKRFFGVDGDMMRCGNQKDLSAPSKNI